MGNFYNKRRREIREEKVIFIFCEGKETEPNYFREMEKDLHLSNIRIIPVGTGFNTESLVKSVDVEVQKVKKDLRKKGIMAGDIEIWIVMDKDDFPNDDFDNAIQMAEEKGYRLAYSNECFELWYLLHFFQYSSAEGRGQYFKKLTKELKTLGVKVNGKLIASYEKQGKNITGLYTLLRSKQGEAIKNAKLLMQDWDRRGIETPSKRKPSTKIHELVERILSFQKRS